MQDKRLQRGKNTLDQLTTVSWELITSQSFDTLSIDAICARIGVTKGAFYHHFKTKTELLQYVYACKMNEYMVNQIRELQTQYPSQLDMQIFGWIRTSISFVERYPSKLVFSPEKNMAWTGPLDEWVESQINILQSAQDNGLLRTDMSACDIWEVISSYIYGVTVLWLEGRVRHIHISEQYLRDFIHTFFK